MTETALDPRATYLRTNDDPDAQAPTRLVLESMALKPGDTACFEATGDFDLGNGLLVSAAQVPLVAAVFSEGDDLAPSDARYRVTGAVGPDRPHFLTPRTVLGDFETDIPQDFDATDVCVTVPPAATHVFLGAWDGYYSDNTPLHPNTYGIRIWRQ